MPINLSAAPSPEPDEPMGTQDAVAPDGTELGQSGTGSEEQPKRTRRTKVELIAAAVVPADDDPIALKDSGTGAKVERPWVEAVALVAAEKAEFVDKSLKYAVIKAEQQQAAPAFAEPSVPIEQTEEKLAVERGNAPATDAFGRPSPEQLEAAQLPTDASGQMVAPEGAEHGDEVVVGAKSYFVGPGGALVDGVVDAQAKRRWQRELGTGVDGPWKAVPIVHPGAFKQPGDAPAEPSAPASQNGNGGGADVTIERERLPHTTEQVDDGSGDGVLKWKIGNGILEKIGLPDYSSYQIGPLSISRMVIDDGRRTVVTLADGREGEVPTAVIEAFETIDNTVEFVAARFRGQLMSFLQATGAIKQPVS